MIEDLRVLEFYKRQGLNMVRTTKLQKYVDGEWQDIEYITEEQLKISLGKIVPAEDSPECGA